MSRYTLTAADIRVACDLARNWTPHSLLESLASWKTVHGKHPQAAMKDRQLAAFELAVELSFLPDAGISAKEAELLG